MLLKIDHEQLRELLRSFYIVANCKIVIFDDDFHKIMSYPEESCAFCGIIKSNSVSQSECNRCDRDAFRTCKETGKIHVQQCHVGLIDVAAPIKVNELVLGYLMFGKILANADKEEEKVDILRKCQHYGFDPAELSGAIDQLIYKSPDEIRSIAKMIELCASYLWVSELIQADDGQFFYKLEQYIESNLSEDLSAARLCDVFEVSKNYLYNTSDHYFGMGIAEYIRRKRIHKAMLMLNNSAKKIKDISQEVGIEDYNYFCKVFHRISGVTPTEFRKKMK